MRHTDELLEGRILIATEIKLNLILKDAEIM
jgi:hypothetical protein